MIALAEVLDSESRTFAGLPTPLTLRLPVPLNNDEFIAFSRRHGSYRMERNAAGELEIMSPVASEGGEWEAEVILELGIWNKAQGGHVYSPNSGFTLPDGSVRSPDAAWISHARWQALHAEERRGFAAVCPEFLIEIISESDARPQVEAKMAMWMANGARLAWMIDPFAAEVSIYRSSVAVERLLRPDWVEAESVVTGFRLEMARLWAK